MANPAPNLPLGTVIQNRYEVLEVLGSGGFATVYKARQLSIERPVAIKVLDHLRSDAEKVDRFKREALIAAKLDHPNIVTIYDVGVHHETQPFIVMELLSGVTLRDELRDFGGIPPTRALPLFVDCLDGLAEAHKSNIVHKDLKPSNLFLHYPRQRRECLRIVDFGVARVLTNDTAHVTLTGNIFGTPRYFSPEYIQRQLVTPALDVYQMALILVEMLTGRPVVDVDNPLECIRIHGSGEIAVPETVIDSPLGEVVVKALSIDHEARYPSAHEFCAALSQIEPESIGRIDVEGPGRLLSELSGGLSPVSLATPPTSGKFASSAGMHVTPPPRPAAVPVPSPEGEPPVAEKVTTILPTTRPEDLEVDVDIELEDLEEFVAEGHDEDVDVAPSGEGDPEPEEKTTEAPIPSYASSGEESTSILGAEVIAELTEIDTGQQRAFERPLEDVISPPRVEDEEPDAEERVGLLPKLILAAALLFFVAIGFIGIAVVVISSTGEQNEPVAPLVTVTVEDEPTPTPGVEEPTEDPPADDPSAVVAAPDTEIEPDAEVEPVVVDLGEEIRVTVEATPESARIYEGEDLLGEGVATVLFTGDDAPARAVRVEADGYNSKDIELTPGDDKVMVELARKPTRPYRPRRPPANNKGMRVLP